jgi:Melibiase
MDTADGRIEWFGGGARLVFAVDPGQPVGLLSFRPAGTHLPVAAGAAPALVQVLARGQGRFPGSHRYSDTTVGARLRYRSHSFGRAGQVDELRVVQHDHGTGIVVTSVFQAADGVPAVRTWTEIGLERPGQLRLEAVTSVVTGSFLLDTGGSVDGTDLLYGDSDWVAESRWHRVRLRDAGLVRMDPAIHHHASRSRFALTSRSSWSTGEHLPTGALTSRDGAWTLCWQIEHNGAWHWEVGETMDAAYVALLGPTDTEHQWSTTIGEGQTFSTVPVSLAVAAGGIDDAFAALTRHRRASLRSRPESLPLIFNDYMNTLMGDPTTAKLLPLIDAAASVGADCFCIDAGWYDEDGHWWNSVGAWQPSRIRFPGGLGEVLARIRSHGMVPGIWLEPEVVGVASPVASRLPDEAFFQRGGERVVEHARYHLDLRHPAARAHLDEVVDRLVAAGIGYFKLDYNIMPGPGTDVGGLTPGEGLLGHNRAHLRWLDGVLDRHPGLLIENCASGGMRMDYAMMSRLHLQSTSDEQNALLYPPIVAASAASLLPEQSGIWAYPQPGMAFEQSVLTLATGMLGRLYLSGYLNRMPPAGLDLVGEAVRAHKALAADIAGSVPFWPLGLAAAPGDPWVAYGLRGATRSHLVVWRLDGADPYLRIDLPHLKGRQVGIEPVFPIAGTGWSWQWDAERAQLHCVVTTPTPAARVISLVPA